MMATLKGVSWGLSSLHRKLDSEKSLDIFWPSSLLLRTKPVVAQIFRLYRLSIGSKLWTGPELMDKIAAHSLLLTPTSTACAEKYICNSGIEIPDWLTGAMAAYQWTDYRHTQRTSAIVKGIVGLNLSWCLFFFEITEKIQRLYHKSMVRIYFSNRRL